MNRSARSCVLRLAIAAAVGVLLLLSPCGCSEPDVGRDDVRGEVKCDAGYASPREAFTGWQDALRFGQWDRVAASLTPEGQQLFALELSFGAIQSAGGAGADGLTDLEPILSRHFVGESEPLEQPAALIAKLLGWAFENGGPVFDADMELADLTVSGDSAQGTAIPKAGGDERAGRSHPITFRRIAGCWYIDYGRSDGAEADEDVPTGRGTP